VREEEREEERKKEERKKEKRRPIQNVVLRTMIPYNMLVERTFRRLCCSA
jgi:hypothetical protein